MQIKVGTLSSLIFLTVTLSGCQLIPNDMYNTQNNQLRGLLSNKQTLNDKKTVSQLTQSEISTTLETMKTYIDEYEALQPKLNKLIAMEQDMHYFIEQLAKTSDLSESTRFIAVDSDSDFDNVVYASDFMTFTDSSNDSETAIISTASDAKFSGTQNIPNQPSDVVVSTAPNIDKFRSLLVPQMRSSPTAIPPSLPQGKDVTIDAKFSSTPELNKNTYSSRNSDQSQLTSALHLVSATKLSGLEDFWRKTSPMFIDEFSGKSPVVEEVIVNGKAFYSLRIGPFSPQQAASNCKQVNLRLGYCGVVKYTGVPLLL